MKNFWQQQAITFGSNVNAVNFDFWAEELETDNIIPFIHENQVIADVGCGNGITTLKLAKKFPNSTFIGFDFVPEMVAIANAEKDKMNLKNISFYQADLSVESSIKHQTETMFDVVISKRLLINLKGNNKFAGISNIYDVLKNDGTYIMIECFLEPLKNINELRSNISLAPIEVKSFNEYLSFDIFESIKKEFTVKNKIDFLSFYYFMSRILNAKLAKGNPKYDDPINEIAVLLSKQGILPIQGFAPELMFILTKTNSSKCFFHSKK
jgi:ubiquinone/menaquinone biosynthesis C-methylase UbiE